MPAKTPTPPTANQAARNHAAMDEKERRIADAITTLTTLVDYIQDDSPGWNYAAPASRSSPSASR